MRKGFISSIYFTVLLLITISAFAQPVPTNEFPFKITVEQYIEKYAPFAIEEMQISRIPASITLAQGLLESGNGNSRLALIGNNHFGIKCKNTWMGETMKEDDDAPQECFRKYKSAGDSYKDHSDFLMKGTRYAFLFDFEQTDYKSWAYGLKKAGYATNPKYPELLIATIEKNNLARFDLMKPGPVEEKKIVEEKKEIIASQRNITVNGIPAIVATKNESYAQIALDNDMRVWQIYKYNDLTKDAELKGGDTIYLKPKNYKSEQEFYIVKSNETMHLISQRFGIKLSKLLNKNLMHEGDEPAIGETIYLKDKRKEPVKLVAKKIIETPLDTNFNNVVYDNPKKNIETLIPVLPEDKFAVATLESKDDMAFFHTVQISETLFSIAKKYNVQVEGIKELNKLKDNIVKVGTQLIINPNQPPINEKEEQVVPGYHTIKQGDTWYAIAHRYNTTVSELKALNENQNDTLKIGDEIIVVPMNGEKLINSETPLKENEPVYHLVKEKETMYFISRKYNVSAEEIRKLNNMMDNNLKVGQRLRIR